MNEALKKLTDKVKARCIKKSSGCLEWQGAKTARGYGVISYGGRNLATHRIALAGALNMPELLNPIDRTVSVFVSQYVLHSCDNPSCCNPKHLRLGTATDNADDCKIRNRRPAFIATLPRKLTPEAVREIRVKATTWEGVCDMMKKYSVGQMCITDVVKGKTYNHVD